MRSSSLLLLMVVPILGLLPGCRSKKAAPPASPWLNLTQTPPDAGAMGILAGPGRGQQVFTLLTEKGASSEAPAVACLSLGQPLLEGEPSAYPAVFAQVQGRALIWGPAGWAWVDLEAGRAQVTTLASHLEAVLNSTRSAIQERTNGEGWTLHNRWVLVLPLQAVRSEPRDDAAYASQGFPDAPLRGEGLWRGARSREFAPGSTAKPLSMLKLDVRISPRPAPFVVARPFERRGDWLQVGFPRSNTATFLVDAYGIGDASENQGLLVNWAPEPAGWVKLQAAGPVPGTSLRQWSWRFLGSRE